MLINKKSSRNNKNGTISGKCGESNEQQHHS